MFPTFPMEPWCVEVFITSGLFCFFSKVENWEADLTLAAPVIYISGTSLTWELNPI